jgi:hypothetical protein
MPPTPRLETIRKICEVLGVTPAEVAEFRQRLEILGGTNGRQPRMGEPNPWSSRADSVSGA